MRSLITIREHELLRAGPRLTDRDLRDLGKLTGKVFKHKNGGLAANNHVGVVTTSRGLVLEILPKIDFGDEVDLDHEKCKKVFLQMLSCWRGLSEALSESGIRAMSRFPMLDVFVRQFLINVNGLTRAGLARRYIPVEENLPYLRGRLHFQGQLRENIANESRFFVTHEVLSVNRPVNRLIRSTLSRLVHVTRSEENLLLLRQLMAKFEEVPQSTNLHSDWEKHHVDRSMQLYAPVMQWVGLFLFNKGLTTFSGHHSNISLLFPMEKVFENFVTHSFSRHQKQYSVAAQHPRKYLATIEGKEAFMTMPDIVLREGDPRQIHPGWQNGRILMYLMIIRNMGSIRPICINSMPTESAMVARQWPWSIRRQHGSLVNCATDSSMICLYSVCHSMSPTPMRAFDWVCRC